VAGVFGGVPGVIYVDPVTGARTALSLNGDPAGGSSFASPVGIAVEPSSLRCSKASPGIVRRSATSATADPPARGLQRHGHAPQRGLRDTWAIQDSNLGPLP